jgi:hypothetical protein
VTRKKSPADLPRVTLSASEREYLRLQRFHADQRARGELDLRHVFLARSGEPRTCHLCCRDVAHRDHVTEDLYATLDKPDPT